MNRHRRLAEKKTRRAERKAKHKSGKRCRFCGHKWWDYDEKRLDAYMAFHVVKECPKAASVVENAIAEREKALALGKAKVLSAEEAEALSRGELPAIQQGLADLGWKTGGPADGHQ